MVTESACVEMRVVDLRKLNGALSMFLLSSFAVVGVVVCCCRRGLGGGIRKS